MAGNTLLSDDSQSGDDYVDGTSVLPASVPILAPTSILEGLRRVSTYFTASLGPRGRLKTFYDASNGLDTLSSSSSILIQHLGVKHRAVSLLISAIQKQLDEHNDFGLFTGILAADLSVALLEETSALPVPYHHCVLEIAKRCISKLAALLESNEERPCRPLDMNNTEDLLAVTETVLRTKAVSCGLRRAKFVEHIKSLVAQAFLISIPYDFGIEKPLKPVAEGKEKQTASPEGGEVDDKLFGKVKIIPEVESTPDKSAVYNGFLYASPFLSETDAFFRACMFPPGGVRVVCFNVPLVFEDTASSPPSVPSSQNAAAPVTRRPQIVHDEAYEVQVLVQKEKREGGQTALSALRRSRWTTTRRLMGGGLEPPPAVGEAAPSPADQLMSFFDDIIAEGVRIVVCQSFVVPEIKKFLRTRGVIVLERLGAVAFEDMVQLCQASPISSLTWPLPNPSLYGRLDSVERVHRRDQRAALLLRKKNTIMSSFVVCANSDYEVFELIRSIEQGLQTLKGLMKDPFLFPGGGCLEMVLAHWLVTQKEDILGPVELPPEKAEKIFAKVIQTFHGLSKKVCGMSESARKFYYDQLFHHLWVLDEDQGLPVACSCGLVLRKLVEQQGGQWVNLKSKSEEEVFLSPSWEYLARRTPLPPGCCVDSVPSKSSAYVLSLRTVQRVLKLSLGDLSPHK